MGVEPVLLNDDAQGFESSKRMQIKQPPISREVYYRNICSD